MCRQTTTVLDDLVTGTTANGESLQKTNKNNLQQATKHGQRIPEFLWCPQCENVRRSCGRLVVFEETIVFLGVLFFEEYFLLEFRVGQDFLDSRCDLGFHQSEVEGMFPCNLQSSSR